MNTTADRWPKYHECTQAETVFLNLDRETHADTRECQHPFSSPFIVCTLGPARNSSTRSCRSTDRWRRTWCDHFSIVLVRCVH